MLFRHVSKGRVEVVARNLGHDDEKMVLAKVQGVDDGRHRNGRVLGDIAKDCGFIVVMRVLEENVEWKCKTHDFEGRAFHFMPESNALVVGDKSDEPYENAVKQRHHSYHACATNAGPELEA